MAGWQRSTRRPPRPQDYNRDDVHKHCDNDDGNDNDNHCGAVVANAGESNRADCYLEPFDNTKIRYVVAAMVEWPMGAELIFAGDLNVDLERTGGR